MKLAENNFGSTDMDNPVSLVLSVEDILAINSGCFLYGINSDWYPLHNIQLK